MASGSPFPARLPISAAQPPGDGQSGWLAIGPERQREWLAARGQPDYRHRQIQQWIFKPGVRRFADMTNLPAAVRQELDAQFVLGTSRVARHHRADDGTEKLLLEFEDGGQIECVLLRDGSRRTVCLSSQVGCAMGCVFCASGLDGVRRNLAGHEIIEQLRCLSGLLAGGERLSHIVMMGMGEPLANLDGVLEALGQAAAPDGLGISPRRMTISTVGLPSAMDRLADRRPRYHLAVSLHAPDDRLRSQLVPVNRQIGLDAILEAADRYFQASGRRLTFEYVLLAGVNDQPDHARGLAGRLAGRTAMVNLIPYNPVAGLGYQTPAPDQVTRFASILASRGLNVQVRQRKGDQISAACGQLRRPILGGQPTGR